MKRVVTVVVSILFFHQSYAQQTDSITNAAKDGGTLEEIVIEGNKNERDIQMKTSQSLILIDESYIEANLSGSLMQTLSGIPGIKAMNIGSGQSKPAIRGLGFNRMVVTENGIKHEGQQWGEDHGLEIDQFAIERVEVIKGPTALLYGSDAIAGVINLYSNYIPTKTSNSSIEMIARSNNESIGLSAKTEGRQNRFYYKANMTWADFADYKIPADSIQYYSYYIKLNNRELRNTAGKEYDESLTLGYIGNKFSTNLKISDAYTKSGFFANAHGLEVRLSDIDYDHSPRDIDLPCQWVNHLKIMSYSTWNSKSIHWNGKLAYQNNYREELTEPISHGYMPTPPNNLERKFVKNTLLAAVGATVTISDKHEINSGINAEYQHNRRNGWGFIIPDFEMISLGGYVFDRYHLSDKLIFSAGMRFDKAHVHIHNYSDWFKTPIGQTDSVYKERSAELDRDFNSVTWSMGINFAPGQWIMKANVGKSFRVPIPKELGADGINYHIFRYEKGTSSLSPEISYQLDAGINWHDEKFSAQIDPFLNYFPNYIYLNPTSTYTEGLQTYFYSQSKVFRCGFETEIKYAFLRNVEAILKGEYLYAKQLSGDKKGYSLPFSPPWNMTAVLTYYLPANQKKGTSFISAIYEIVGDQNSIVPPEKATEGYKILNFTVGKTFAWNNYLLKMNIQCSNLLNKKYYDHTSYYRLIDVPEPGRNFSIIIGLDF